MAVYTDGIVLMADTVEELHQFAGAIGIKPSWFNDHKHKHYDLFGVMVEKAIAGGAIVKDSRFLVGLKSNKDSRDNMKIV